MQICHIAKEIGHQKFPLDGISLYAISKWINKTYF